MALQSTGSGIAASGVGSVRSGSRLESGPRQGVQRANMIQIGEDAPVFSLPDADMELFDLAEEIGRHHVVLYFYPRDNTPGCTLQAADFSDHEDDFTKLGAIVVGISPDDCLTHAEFRDYHGLSIRLLSDEDTDVCRLYGVWQSRMVDGVPRVGLARTTFIIDKHGVVRHILRDVSPRGHAADVYKLVKDLETEYANGNR